MAIVQAMIAFIGRSLGKILNTVFGWATIMLFGKVSEDRQIYLSILAFGSIAWLVALLGIAFPSVATFLLAFVPLPSWVDANWVRLAMLATAILAPPVLGYVGLLMLEPEDRPPDLTGKAKAVIRGYLSTPSLATTLVMVTLFAPIIRVQSIIRGWTSQHVPVIVEDKEYFKVIGELQQALKKADLDTERRQANWMIRVPTKIVTLLAGGSMKNLVANNLTTLQSQKLEVTLHPADMVVKGKEVDVAHARAVIAEQLAFSKAYMTWDKEGNELEDRIDEIWREVRSGANGALWQRSLAKLREVKRDLMQAEIPYEEWEVLYREQLLVERGILETMAGLTDKPRDATESREEERGVGRASSPWQIPRLVAVSVAAVAVLGAAAGAIAFAWRGLGGHR